MYLPWALRVLGALAGLVSHHPPEERTVEAAALNLHTLAGSSGSQLAIPPLHSPAHQATPGSSTWSYWVGAAPLSPPRPSRAGVGSDPPLSLVPTSPEHTLAGVCRRNGWVGEGEGIHSLTSANISEHPLQARQMGPLLNESEETEGKEISR